MPRPARRILTCVLIGLLINAAVTAVCWLAQPTRFHRQTQSTTIGTPGPGEFVSSTTTIHYLMHSVETRTAGRSLPGQDTEGWEHARSTSDWQYLYKFGVPFRSLQHRNSRQWSWSNQRPGRSSTDTTYSLSLFQRGLPSGLTSLRYKLFPVDPVLPGFLLNTLLYAGIPAAVMTASHLRASRRRRQSRCPACGYPLTGLPTCPECGNTPPVARLAEPGL